MAEATSGAAPVAAATVDAWRAALLLAVAAVAHVVLLLAWMRLVALQLGCLGAEAAACTVGVPSTAFVVVAGGVLVRGVGLAARVGREQFRGARRLRRAMMATSVEEPRVARIAAELCLPVVVSWGVTRPTAVTLGVRRPVVVVAVSLLELVDDAELRAILAHEAEHVRRRDPCRFGLHRVLAAGMWLLPAARDWSRALVLRGEMAADAAAVRVTSRATLARALLALAEVERPRPVHGARADGMVEPRVAALLGRRWRERTPSRTRRVTGVGAVVLGVLLVVAVVLPL